jgi:hypothetical protein
MKWFSRDDPDNRLPKELEKPLHNDAEVFLVFPAISLAVISVGSNFRTFRTCNFMTKDCSYPVNSIGTKFGI